MLGRFLTADRGPAAIANPLSWNRYSYSWNDPVNVSDPDGMLPDSHYVDGGAAGTIVITQVVFDGEYLREEAVYVSERTPHYGRELVARSVQRDTVTTPLMHRDGYKAIEKLQSTRCGRADVLGPILKGLSTLLGTMQFYDARPESSYATMTQHEVAGNGNETTLIDTLGSNDAVTLRKDGNITNVAVVGAAGMNGFTAVHETLHYGLQTDDIGLLKYLTNYGFVHKGEYLDSAQFTEWFNDGCPDMRKK